MKVVPHFRVYGKHSESCDIYSIRQQGSNKGDLAPIKEEKRKIDESIVDQFFMKRPRSYYENLIKNEDVVSNKNIKIGFFKRSQDVSLRERGSVGELYSVRSIVGRYIRYTNDKSLKYRRININGLDVHYENIFKSIALTFKV